MYSYFFMRLSSARFPSSWTIFRWFGIIKMLAFEAEKGEDEETLLVQLVAKSESFVARLFGTGVVEWQSFPTRQLRQGLEDSLAEDGTLSAGDNSKAAIASKWTIQAGHAPLQQCLLGSNDLDEDLRTSYRAGDLFSGHPELCLEC